MDMKKNKILYIALAAAVMVTSCKQEPIVAIAPAAAPSVAASPGTLTMTKFVAVGNGFISDFFNTILQFHPVGHLDGPAVSAAEDHGRESLAFQTFCEELHEGRFSTAADGRVSDTHNRKSAAILPLQKTSGRRVRWCR